MEMLALDAGPAPPASRRVGAAELRRLSTSAYYDLNAEEYAASTMQADVRARVARFASMLRREASVLDVGCGAGRDLVGLQLAGLRPIGLELSPSLASIARDYAALPVRIGDLRNPPFEAGSFDGVWAMASLLHLEREEVVATLRRLRRLLRPGGVLFTSVKRGCGRVRDDEGRWFTLHDEASWRRQLRAGGLEVIEVEGEPPVDGGAVGSVSPGWVCSLSRSPA